MTLPLCRSIIERDNAIAPSRSAVADGPKRNIASYWLPVSVEAAVLARVFAAALVAALVARFSEVFVVAIGLSRSLTRSHHSFRAGAPAPPGGLVGSGGSALNWFIAALIPLSIHATSADVARSIAGSI